MDFEVLTELKPKYAGIICRGVLNTDAMLGVWERAFRFAASEGRKAVLVDIRDLTGEPFTIMDRYEGAKRIVELQRGCGSGISLALVGTEPMMDRQKFGENVARNRGAYARAFTDVDEAIGWIEKVLDDAGSR